MVQERYLLSREAVRRLRQDRRWSQQRLAQEAGLSKELIQGIERGKLVYRDTVDRVAKALAVESDEIVEARVTTWQWIPDLGDRRLVVKLERAVRLDMQGEHDRAVELCREVFKNCPPEANPARYAAVFVKLITFLDHAGRHAEVLAKIADFLRWAERADVSRWDILRVQYHQAICLRRLERFEEARGVLAPLCSERRRDFIASVLHQVGCIELEKAKREPDGETRLRLLEKARDTFRRSLAEWEEVGASHRMGYTLDRLGQTLALLEDYKEALEYFCRALRVFARHSCSRYADMTEADIREYVLARILAA